MDGSNYLVQMEIAGPLALFARPDTGATPTSYPVPTWSATKGMFESIARLPSGEAWIEPVRLEICRRVGQSGGEIRYQRYTTNYGGPLRLKTESSFQLYATALSDVCYRLHGMVRGSSRSARDYTNARHHLQHLFNRRLKQGRCYRTPCLGWSEFTASYWGSFRDGANSQPIVTELDADLNLTIPSLLERVFDEPVSGRYSPRFLYDVEVRGGILDYQEARRRHAG